MRLLLFLLLPIFGYSNDIIRCAPEVKDTRGVFATVSSVKNGNWYDGTTWSTGRVPSEVDDITVSHSLTSSKIVVIKGRLISNKMRLTFTNIDENKMVGSNFNTANVNDIGLFVLDNGQLDLNGQTKTSWTNAVGSVAKGVRSIIVKDPTGWSVGDEIIVCPTRMPTKDPDWDDRTNSLIDPMVAEFESRIITGINGNIITFATPLTYDHLSVTSTLGNKTWTAEVENLTRSVIIEGTQSGRSHIFINSGKPQTIRFVKGQYLGPRKGGSRSKDIIQGLYGLHAHLSGYGSSGSLIEGCAFSDIGSRVYVPHTSHGMTFKNNVAHRFMESSFWWDRTERTHLVKWDGNLSSMMLWNGLNKGTTAFEMGLGDGNIANNNVAVYCHTGQDAHQQGAFAWNANSTGVWEFKNNLSHSNVTALFVWDNSPLQHVFENYDSYNNYLGTHHGAYINSYNYRGGVHYNSRFSFEATSGNTTPMFENIVFDGGDKVSHVVICLSSPATAGQSNDFVNCRFGGYSDAAFYMNTSIFENENGKKIIDAINSTFSGKVGAYTSTSIYDSYFRVQPKTGQPYQITKAGQSNISPFYHTVFGTGTGLDAKYYNGQNFNQFAFSRVDPLIKFQQWTIDKDVSPDGVDHRIIPNSPFSIEWNGYYEPQVSGQQQFSFESFGGVRFWVEDKMIMERWGENPNPDKIDAPLVQMDLGKKYKIKIQHFDNSGNRGIQLFTKRSDGYWNVPMSQLYPLSGTTPPVQTNRPPIVNAGPDVVLTLPDSLFKLEGSVSDPDGNLANIAWSGGLPEHQKLSDAAHYLGVARQAGKYTMTLTAKDGQYTVSDQVIVTVLPKKDTTTANICAVFDPVFYLAYYKDIRDNWRGTPISHYEAYGKREGRVINPACVPNFKNAGRTDSITCISGELITATVPAGKYTASTQALADALAIKDISEQLSKCPVPWFTTQLPSGKTLYLFGTESQPRITIK